MGASSGVHNETDHTGHLRDLITSLRFEIMSCTLLGMRVFANSSIASLTPRQISIDIR